MEDRLKEQHMAYNYEKVNQKLLVQQIEDQLVMYIQHENIGYD